MEIGLVRLQIHLHAASSLKDKRKVVKSLIGRARAQHNVSAAEVDHHDLIQRSEIAFVAVGGKRDLLDLMFDSIVQEAERASPGDASSRSTGSSWADDEGRIAMKERQRRVAE
jgi:uncharacterized protein YlxP (DUF503 family)